MFAAAPSAGAKLEAVNRQHIVSVGPGGYRMNKSAHPVDLNVCDLTPLSLPPLLL